jgi:hypothetical protein
VILSGLVEVPFAPENVGSMFVQNIDELLQTTWHYTQENSNLHPITRLFFFGCKLDDPQM